MERHSHTCVGSVALFDSICPVLSRDVLGTWETDSFAYPDGGGTRGYASLLMLQELMTQIAFIEENGTEMSSNYGEDFEPHHSSFGRSDGDSILVSKSAAAEPISNSQPAIGLHLNRGFSFRQRVTQPQDRIDRLAQRRVETRQELLFERSKYLPCHYFDYIGGTSTGGLAALLSKKDSLLRK